MDTSSIPCRYLSSPNGCRLGENCSFSHATQGGSGGYKGKNFNSQYQNNHQNKQHNNNNNNFKKQGGDGEDTQQHWEIPENCPIQGITSSSQDRAWYWKQESAHVLADLEPGPQWLFSCYAQDDHGENVTYEGDLVFADYCPEELAWETINAAQTNSLNQFEAQFNTIATEYMNKKGSIIANCKDQLTQCYPLRGTGQGKAMKMQHHENRFSNGAKNNNNNNNNHNNNNHNNNNNPNPNYKGKNPNPNYKGNNPNPNYNNNNNNNHNNNNNNYNNQNNNQNTNPNYKGKGGGGGNKSFNYKNKSNNNSMGDSSCPW
jgi:hypothetical protein